jgi:hypothetical protein
MRAALRANPQRRQVSVGQSIPAPIGGWDAYNPLAAMPIENAVILDNWVPRAGYVEMRRGYVQHASGFTSPAESLMAFRGGPAGDSLFAAAGGEIHDVTDGGLIGAPIASGFSCDRWNSVNYSNAAGAWLVAVNGQDAPQGYNLGAWAPLPALSGSSGPIVLAPESLFNVFAHKGRLHYLEQGTLRVWNPAAGAVGGACTLLDLSSIFSKGGRLVAGGGWSYQFGVTADDYAVYVSDQGQVAIYQGSDPTNASDWSLVGVYDFGPPLGPKGLLKFGGDLAVLTSDGVIPLSQGLKLDRSRQNEVALTAKIVNAFSAAVKNYAANHGWQGILYPGQTQSADVSASGGSLAIFNVPVSPPPWNAQTTYPASTGAQPMLVLGSDETVYASAVGSNLGHNPVGDGGVHWTAAGASGGTNIQFVQNVMTGAWCRFVNLDAFCWELANGAIYFGSTLGVFQWDVGSDDSGTPITGDVKSAFTNFGDGSRQKRFTMIRPLLYTTSAVRPTLEIDVDYQESEPTAAPTISPQGAAAAIRYDWTSASGIGYVGAARMQVQLQGDTAAALLGVGDTPPHDLGIDSSDDTLLTQGSAPFDVPCQLLGFDVVYEVGGLI